MINIFQAAKSSGRKIKVIAVEKNTNAVVTLLTQKDEQWGDLVDVVSGKNKSIIDLVLTPKIPMAAHKS